MTASRAWSVELEHRVHGTPEAVFEYFVDPEKYRRWKGREAQLDPRPGGTYRVTMAPEVWVRGRYLAVEPPHRLLMTWGFESANEIPRGLGSVAPGSSTVEFRFIPDGDATIIRVTHNGLPTEGAQWAHEEGWKSYLPRLEAILAKGDPGEDPYLTLGIALFARENA